MSHLAFISAILPLQFFLITSSLIFNANSWENDIQVQIDISVLELENTETKQQLIVVNQEMSTLIGSQRLRETEWNGFI